jgi:hypothetical protein
MHVRCERRLIEQAFAFNREGKSIQPNSDIVAYKAFQIWEAIEALSDLLWETFDKEFMAINDIQEDSRLQMRSDSEDEQPF